LERISAGLATIAGYSTQQRQCSQSGYYSNVLWGNTCLRISAYSAEWAGHRSGPLLAETLQAGLKELFGPKEIGHIDS